MTRGVLDRFTVKLGIEAHAREWMRELKHVSRTVGRLLIRKRCILRQYSQNIGMVAWASIGPHSQIRVNRLFETPRLKLTRSI